MACLGGQMKPVDSRDEWPSDGIEVLGCCPVCKGLSKDLVYSDQSDMVFKCAPGDWDLWQCNDCGCNYVDPRPDEGSTHLAYENYYTHGKVYVHDKYKNLSRLRKFKRRLVNGYLKHRYSKSISPLIALGKYLVYLLPKIRRRLDRTFRSMPMLPSKGGDLLDVGCGNGSFLYQAKEIGWRVNGVDFDSMAIEALRLDDMPVGHGGIELFSEERELFDVITLSHVIEHVHDPVFLLERCKDLLKPNGYLWIETPNSNSYSHSVFSSFWRGLEIPRHLTLFNYSSMRYALEKSGFNKVNVLKYTNPIESMFKKSYAISLGCSPYANIKLPIKYTVRMYLYKVIGLLVRSRSEYLSISAYK